MANHYYYYFFHKLFALFVAIQTMMMILPDFLSDYNTMMVMGEFQLCTPSYCLNTKCGDQTCKGDDKILFHNVTRCGCCHRCVEQLEENSDCLVEMKGNVPSTQCGPHLICEKDPKTPTEAKCKKISEVNLDGCEAKRKQIEENQFQMIYSRPPQCDQFGDYSRVQCKNGTLCQCVKTYIDSNGIIQTRPIFGTNIYTDAADMNCLCSYQFENTNEKLREMTRSLKENERWSLMDLNGKYHSGLPLPALFHPRCQPNGNYDPLQVYGQYYYCVDEETGQVQDRPVLYEHAQKLPCFRHRDQDSMQCLKHYNKTVEEYYLVLSGFNDGQNKDQNDIDEAVKDLFASTHSGYDGLVAFDLPKCDLDGSYAPVQCQNDKCYCVNKKGKRYNRTEIYRADSYFATSQQCTCVRNQDLIRDIKQRDKITEVFSKYQCDINGNYLPLQCSNTECYCVDPITGFAEIDTDQALKTEVNAIRLLKCYRNYPDDQKERLERQLFDLDITNQQQLLLQHQQYWASKN